MEDTVSYEEDTTVGYNLPKWIEPEYKQVCTQVSHSMTSIAKARRAITLLEEHDVKDTVPKSISVKIRLQVTKNYQTDVNAAVLEATKIFQKTVLKTLIDARKKELLDKIKTRDDLTKNILIKIIEGLTDLKRDGIITHSDDYIKKWQSGCKITVESDFKKLEEQIRTEEFFEYKKKIESTEAAAAVRAEAAINDALIDPATKTMQARIDSLEKQVEKATKPKGAKPPGTTATTKRKTDPKKGKGPHPKKGGGPKPGSGSGNRKPQHPSTPSTHQSGLRKSGSRKKRA